MKRTFARTVFFFDRVFGSCPVCMRRSFVSALAAWAACLVALLVRLDQPLLTVFVLAAIGLTGLWALHVATFAGRALVFAGRRIRRTMGGSQDGGTIAPERAGFDRRMAMGIFFKAAGAAALTSLSFWPFALLADAHQCADGTRCHSGYKCCWNSQSGAYFCCDSSHVCCTSGQSSYCRNPSANEHC